VSPEELKKILEKYKVGECSPEELLIVNRFFEVTENKNISVFKNDLEKNQIEIDLKNRIDETINRQGGILLPFFKQTIFYQLAAAAVLVICIGFGYLFFKDNSTDSTNVLEIYQTSRGKKQDLILSDGTKVHLNSGSIFKAPKRFTGVKRIVYLEGEAFFEVAKNDKMPFVIISEKLSTQVVGTSFNVKAFRNSKNIEVAVMTGKVKVFDKNTDVILTPNQKVTYEKISGKLQKQAVLEITNYNAWMKGTLVFEKKSMEEIIKDLNRNFNIEIKLEGEKLKKCELSVRFENDSLETILQILCSYTDAKYVRTGNKIVITGKGC
jgi:transmembrane sensor